MYTGETDTELDRYTPIVARFLSIEDVTHGGSDQKFLMRYRGRLRIDSAEAYDQMATLLRTLDVTPMFRKEHDRHAVFLVSGVNRPKPSRTWVNVLLFVLTVLSMFVTGVVHTLGNQTGGAPINGLKDLLPYIPASLGGGLAFALSLIAILLAHEFGHYIAGRLHNTQVTLPYFLPFPFSTFGTLGAFIQLKELPRNRRVLLDIGLAGPLAGLVITLPVLVLGLSLSKISPLPATLAESQGLFLEGNSLLYLFSKFLVFGRLLPEPGSYAGLPALLYWLRYFFTGQPFPLGGVDVMLHPVALAGWAGLLVTALNLTPAGQLDGGHITYVLLGEHVNKLLPFILAFMLLMGMFWQGWWLLAVLIFLFGRSHAEPLDQITPLDPPRRLLAVVGLIIFLLVFTPVPMLQF